MANFKVCKICNSSDGIFKSDFPQDVRHLMKTHFGILIGNMKNEMAVCHKCYFYLHLYSNFMKIVNNFPTKTSNIENCLICCEQADDNLLINTEIVKDLIKDSCFVKLNNRKYTNRKLCCVCYYTLEKFAGMKTTYMLNSPAESKIFPFKSAFLKLEDVIARYGLTLGTPFQVSNIDDIQQKIQNKNVKELKSRIPSKTIPQKRQSLNNYLKLEPAITTDNIQSKNQSSLSTLHRRSAKGSEASNSIEGIETEHSESDIIKEGAKVKVNLKRKSSTRNAFKIKKLQSALEKPIMSEYSSWQNCKVVLLKSECQTSEITDKSDCYVSMAQVPHKKTKIVDLVATLSDSLESDDSNSASAVPAKKKKTAHKKHDKLSSHMKQTHNCLDCNTSFSNLRSLKLHSHIHKRNTEDSPNSSVENSPKSLRQRIKIPAHFSEESVDEIVKTLIPENKILDEVSTEDTMKNFKIDNVNVKVDHKSLDEPLPIMPCIRSDDTKLLVSSQIHMDTEIVQNVEEDNNIDEVIATDTKKDHNELIAVKLVKTSIENVISPDTDDSVTMVNKNDCKQIHSDKDILSISPIVNKFINEKVIENSGITDLVDTIKTVDAFSLNEQLNDTYVPNGTRKSEGELLNETRVHTNSPKLSETEQHDSSKYQPKAIELNTDDIPLSKGNLLEDTISFNFDESSLKSQHGSYSSVHGDTTIHSNTENKDNNSTLNALPVKKLSNEKITSPKLNEKEEKDDSPMVEDDSISTKANEEKVDNPISKNHQSDMLVDTGSPKLDKQMETGNSSQHELCLIDILEETDSLQTDAGDKDSPNVILDNPQDTHSSISNANRSITDVNTSADGKNNTDIEDILALMGS